MQADDANPKQTPQSGRRALIVKFGAIGDVIMAIPAAHALYAQGFAIDWVCGPVVQSVLRFYPWIDTIVADDASILKGSAIEKLKALLDLWRRLAGRRYDLVATLYYDARYRLLAWPVRAERRLMLSHTERQTRLLPGRHHTDEYARILLGRPDQATPLPLAPVRPEHLPPSPLPRTACSRVVLAPAGARNLMNDDKLRRWPPELYVALAALLLAAGNEVVLIGGPDDAWVRPLFAALAVTDCLGQHRLGETLALLDEADVLVTHDTGPLHLGGITRVGIVSLFGPTDPRGRLPQRPGALAIWGGEGFACRPCYDAHSFAPCPDPACLRQITPAMVAAEVATMLAERTAGRLGAPRVVVPGSTVGAGRLVQLEVGK
jgi:heptosyltransferase-2